MELFEIREGFSISRVIKGGWQLSHGHSQSISGRAVEDMLEFVQAGITTFDCADIYTGVEELIGQFNMSYKDRLSDQSQLKILTKFVPDYDLLHKLRKADVEKIIDRSLKRLGLERLDMVQFAWWNYETTGYVETALWLKELQDAGKIDLLSITNFNASTTGQILEAGVDIATTQVQYSLLDNRPERMLTKLCKQSNTFLLCYGTVAGGFLSEKWLGVQEPELPLENRSLIKYKLIIDDIGGWDVYQNLLESLSKIATKYHTCIANVASRYILQKPQVAGVIVGARNADHLSPMVELGSIKLAQEDISAIDGIIGEFRPLDGDVFDLERIKEGPHGKIMKYNLNKVA